MRGKTKEGAREMSSAGQVVPEMLLQIPEIVEVSQIISRGSLAPNELIKIRLPFLSANNRLALESYLSGLEEDYDYVTDLFVTTKEVVITIVPTTALLMILQRDGCFEVA